MQFGNIPQKHKIVANDETIKGEASKYHFEVFTVKDGQRLSTICQIAKGHEDATAREIAWAIEAARDAGYRQALHDIQQKLQEK